MAPKAELVEERALTAAATFTLLVDGGEDGEIMKIKQKIKRLKWHNKNNPATLPI